ncbi:tripeptidyl-peptidase 1 [Nannizzia gypsea CBS 118893]|uniref:tripeptidyl-peptidase II n=1 Tax=Arthroderma gypseum (strain ATCC MYA-4604 / CBS 118893) TaxID=535722 RepID=E5R1L9_ARTGP|nr:tripeptidyl-peptidase 1 [Nannizzia gypsea CBS 118893]EFQ97717.1 tripeptidyl-peptidase 1 [Nannizzia gypsea CBS 118893]
MRVLKFVCLLASVAAAKPTSWPSHKVVERLDFVPEGWQMVGAADPTAVIDFWLAIERENPEKLYDTIYDVSTPGRARYGKHLKREELDDLVRPRAETSESIVSWLTNGGVNPQRIRDEGDWIKFSTNVKVAEQLMKTQFHVFKDDVNSALRIRTLEYSVPAAISAHVQMIQPTTLFGRQKPQNSLILNPLTKDLEGMSVEEFAASKCSYLVTTACLRELYGLGDRVTQARDDNRIGVSGFLEEYAQYRDLDLFLSRFEPSAKGFNFSVGLIAGGKNTQGGSGSSTEANLDMQYVVGLSHKAKVTYYSTAGRGPLIPDLSQPDQASNNNEPYLEQLRYLVKLPKDQLPSVLTTSYGDTEQSLPASYTKATCDLFAQLGTMGVSVIFSSGDTGPGSSCQTNDGKNSTRFNPIYPASCPFVTSIGGTAGTEPERAVSFSSGGFSDRFPRPQYQDNAVKGYLKILGNQWSGLFNPNGRAFPDIAAQGSNFAVYDKGRMTGVSGTSASAPAMAAIIAQLNDFRLAKGSPVLGFLNPWIYSKGFSGFTDIVDGGSKGCTGYDIYSGLKAKKVPYASWNATKGWDPVTGFGTPNFQALTKVLP